MDGSTVIKIEDESPPSSPVIDTINVPVDINPLSVQIQSPSLSMITYPPKASTFCAYQKCINNKLRKKDCIFFCFPRNEERLKEWVDACRRPDLKVKASKTILCSYRVCEEHFERVDFVSRNRLFPHAVPKLDGMHNCKDSDEALTLNAETQELKIFTCSALGCENTTESENVTFYGFPLQNKVLLKQWLLALKRELWTPNEYSKICSWHFTLRDFTDVINKSELTPFAIPLRIQLPAFLQPSRKDDLAAKMAAESLLKSTSVSEVMQLSQTSLLDSNMLDKSGISNKSITCQKGSNNDNDHQINEATLKSCHDRFMALFGKPLSDETVKAMHSMIRQQQKINQTLRDKQSEVNRSLEFERSRAVRLNNILVSLKQTIANIMSTTPAD